MRFKINGLSGHDRIEEVLNDADTRNMVYYKSGYDSSIEVFMVEHDPPVAVLPSELDGSQGQQSYMVIVRTIQN